MKYVKLFGFIQITEPMFVKSWYRYSLVSFWNCPLHICEQGGAKRRRVSYVTILKSGIIQLSDHLQNLTGVCLNYSYTSYNIIICLKKFF